MGDRFDNPTYQYGYRTCPDCGRTRKVSLGYANSYTGFKRCSRIYSYQIGDYITDPKCLDPERRAAYATRLEEEKEAFEKRRDASLASSKDIGIFPMTPEEHQRVFGWRPKEDFPIIAALLWEPSELDYADGWDNEYLCLVCYVAADKETREEVVAVLGAQDFDQETSYCVECKKYFFHSSMRWRPITTVFGSYRPSSGDKESF